MFKVDGKVFKNALAAVKPAIDKYNGIPVLQGVHLRLTEGLLDVQCQGQVRLTKTIEAEGDGTPDIVLPFDLVAGVLKTTKPGDVVTVDDSADQVVLRVGNRYRTIVPFDVNEWPRQFSEKGVYSGVRNVDLTGLRDVAVAATSDDNRPVLNGVLIDDGHWVATDSYRLYTHAGAPQFDAPVNIPLVAVKELLRNKKNRDANMIVRFDYRPAPGVDKVETVPVAVSAGFGDSLMIDFRPTEGDYPNYRGLLETVHDSVIEFDTRGLLEGLTQIVAGGLAGTASNSSNHPVKIGVANDVATLTLSDGDTSDSVELPCSGVEDGFVTALNPHYFKQLVEGIESDVFGLNVVAGSVGNPVLFEDDVRQRLLMPVRVSEAT